MSNSPEFSHTQQDAVALHQRLLARDPTASNDLAEAYLEPLVVWLSETDAGVPEDARMEAAEDAILALIRNPESYSPSKQTLEIYLRMSARADLLNLLRREGRHVKGRISLSSVELSPDAGKYLGRDDDPSLSLCVDEEKQTVASAIPDAVRRGLSEEDQRAMELILQGERRTPVFVELYGLNDLPAQEQRGAVKRHKDRLKKLLKRSGRKP